MMRWKQGEARISEGALLPACHQGSRGKRAVLSLHFLLFPQKCFSHRMCHMNHGQRVHPRPITLVMLCVNVWSMSLINRFHCAPVFKRGRCVGRFRAMAWSTGVNNLLERTGIKT